MKYPIRLKEGVFLKRYKRFFADFTYENSQFTAHVANSGSMKGCNVEGSPCRFIHYENTARKLAYSLEMVKPSEYWVGVNTMRPNQLLWEAWESKSIAHWSAFDRAQKEVKINEHSRIDMVLWNSRDWEIDHFNKLNDGRHKKYEKGRLKNHAEGRLKNHDFTKAVPKMHLVEIKNVSLAESSVALFPDSVTERGQKHLRDLMCAIDQGHTAELVFVIQREDCSSFSPADEIDSEYGRLLRVAVKHGVKVSIYSCLLSEDAIELNTNPIYLQI
jgi:sugar fermentation stimulation protein A